MVLQRSEQIFHVGVLPVRAQCSRPERFVGPVHIAEGYPAWSLPAAPQGLRSLMHDFLDNPGKLQWKQNLAFRHRECIADMLHTKAWNSAWIRVNRSGTICDLEIIVVISLENPHKINAVLSLRDYFHDQQIQPSPNKADVYIASISTN